MSKRRASTSRLELGEHSIDRVTPRWHKDEYWLEWSIRLYEDRKPVQKRTKAKTKGEVRRRAKLKAKELVEAAENDTWTPTDSLIDYMEAVTKPAIENSKLAKASRDRYLLVYKLLVGKCTRTDHKHQHGLKRHSIATGTRFRVLENCLIEIATLHGSETGHQARSVLGKYVLDQLIRDDMINASPISGKRIDLTGNSTQTSSGNVALSLDEWNSSINYLLTLDPADGVVPPKRGMYTLDDKIAVKANAIDLTLLQAFTGMRIGEATLATWEMATFNDNQLSIDLPPEITKTKNGRTVQVVNDELVDRFRSRFERARSLTHPIIPSPAKPWTTWAPRQRNDAVKELYLLLAKDLKITKLETKRSHVWRATVNTLAMMAGVPEAIRSEHLGHTTKVNRGHYTDARDGSLIANSLNTMRTP